MNKTSPRFTLVDMPFVLITLVAGLNLAGITLVLFGKEGLLSNLILLTTIFTIIRFSKFSHFTKAYGFFIAAIFLYLLGGLAGNLVNGTFDFAIFRFYIATLIFISACYFWLMAQDEAKLEYALRFFKFLLLLTCLSVIFSDQFYELNGRIPPLRKSGFFLDPNQASMSGLYCMVLIIAYPAKNSILNLLQILTALLAIILPFSKTGILLAIILAIPYILQSRSIKKLSMVFVLSTVLVAGTWYAYQNDMFELKTEQLVRIEAIVNILSGNADEKTTTGRSEIWAVGLNQIADNFPWGAGLGEFHAVKGGMRDLLTGDWLGIHNTYLLILGEGGFIAISALALFLFYIIWYGAKSRYRIITIGFAIILLGNMSSTHGVLAKRQVDLVIAFMMVFATKYNQAPTKAPDPIRQYAPSIAKNRQRQL